jgi:hypothetical protein
MDKATCLNRQAHESHEWLDRWRNHEYFCKGVKKEDVKHEMQVHYDQESRGVALFCVCGDWLGTAGYYTIPEIQKVLKDHIEKANE